MTTLHCVNDRYYAVGEPSSVHNACDGALIIEGGKYKTLERALARAKRYIARCGYDPIVKKEGHVYYIGIDVCGNEMQGEVVES